MEKIKNFLSENYTGLSILCGGCLIHLVLGSFYLWGVINVYVTSYFRLHSDSSLKIEMTSFLFSVMLLAISIGFFFGLPLSKYFGYRLTVFIMSFLIAVCVFVSSYMPNFWLYMVFYGILFGFLNGLIYMIPISLASQYFPTKRGLISGIVTGFFGLATIFSSQLVQNIVNPDNLKATLIDNGDKYFDKHVADSVPRAIRYLSLYFLLLGVIGSFLIRDPPAINDDLRKCSSVNNPLIVQTEGDRVIATLKNPKLYIIFLMNLLSCGYGLMIAGNLKNYGMDSGISDDSFLTIVGSVGAVCNGLFRVVWGFCYDFVSFRTVYSCLLILQLICIASFNSIAHIKSLFFIWSCLSFFCEGGHFALFPALCLKEFGIEVGGKVYPFVYFAFAIANFIQFGVVYAGKNNIGWENILWIYLGITTAAGLLLWTVFKEKEKKKKEEAI